MPEKEKARMTVDLDRQLHEDIKTSAREEGVSLNRWMVDAVKLKLGAKTNLNTVISGIIDGLIPGAQEVSSERLEEGTFLISWRDGSSEHGLIIRDGKIYKLEQHSSS